MKLFSHRENASSAIILSHLGKPDRVMDCIVLLHREDNLITTSGISVYPMRDFLNWDVIGHV